MTAVGSRTYSTTGKETGASFPIHEKPNVVPELYVPPGRIVEVSMAIAPGSSGRTLVLADVYRRPDHTLFTLNGSGGCVPIAAAEYDDARQTVLWTYLLHGHGGNHGIDLVKAAKDPKNVFIAVLLYTGAFHSLDVGKSSMSHYLDVLAPGKAIPDDNVSLIHCPHVSLAITPSGLIGVVAGGRVGRAPPAVPVKA